MAFGRTRKIKKAGMIRTYSTVSYVRIKNIFEDTILVRTVLRTTVDHSTKSKCQSIFIKLHNHEVPHQLLILVP